MAVEILKITLPRIVVEVVEVKVGAKEEIVKSNEVVVAVAAVAATMMTRHAEPRERPQTHVDFAVVRQSGATLTWSQ